MLRARPNRRTTAVAAAAALAASGVTLIAPAEAAFAVDTPHLKVVDVGHHSFTVSVSGTSGRFKLYAAHRVRGVSVVNLGSASASKWTHSRNVTISGLKYSTKVFYYRLIAESRGHHAYSAIEGPIGLAPSKPTSLSVSTPGGAISLRWDSGPATGYQVVQSTDSGFSTNKKVYTLHGLDKQFTPPDLDKGTTYFFKVRARNLTSNSGLSAAVSTSPGADQQRITVMTYNVKEARFDGQHRGGNVVAPWPQREVAAAQLIKPEHPDFILLQEAASFSPPSSINRQCETLRDELKSLGLDYVLATTEIPPSQPHYHRTGDYILYNPANYEAVGKGDHWALGESRWAAYQLFRNVNTSSRVLVVSFHLLVGDANGNDAKRQAEVESMVQQAKSYSAAHGDVPIVYGGDTNSQAFVHKNGETRHEFDGARAGFRAHGISGASDVAQSRKNAKYNSANGYRTKPPKLGIYLDDLFAAPGIAVSDWKMLLNLRHGKFVGTIPSDHNPIVATMYYPF
jgi:hypothetical protein